MVLSSQGSIIEEDTPEFVDLTDKVAKNPTDLIDRDADQNFIKTYL